jgi:hypothetical protein
MDPLQRTLLSMLAGASLLITAGAAAHAQCVTKGGQGTGANEQAAKFQAWEAVLQATDWGSWLSWMGSSGKEGVAPGYKVSNMKVRCSKGGLGAQCKIQAKLCK